MAGRRKKPKEVFLACLSILLLLGGITLVAFIERSDDSTKIPPPPPDPSADIGVTGKAVLQDPMPPMLTANERPSSTDAHQVLEGDGDYPNKSSEEFTPPPGVDERLYDLVLGQVLDADTKLPIEGVRIVLGDPREGKRDPNTVTHTDAAGCFQYELTYWDMHGGTLTIETPGYEYDTRFRSAIWDGQEKGNCGYIYYLKRGSTLHGMVEDEDGVAFSSGCVFACPENMVPALETTRVDRFSDAAYKSEYRHEVHSRPAASIGEDGAFTFQSLSANTPMALMVMSPSAERSFIATVILEPGEEQMITLVAKRARSMPGVLVPPAGERPEEYGLWVCTHRSPRPHVQGCALGRDLWIPVQGDGTFLLGPLPKGRAAHVRVAHCPSVLRPVRHPYDLYASDCIYTIPADSDMAGTLEVNLGYPDHFLIQPDTEGYRVP